MFNALSTLKSTLSRQGGRCYAGDSTDEGKGNFVSPLSEPHVWCCNHEPYSPNRSHSPWSAIPPAWNRSSGCHCGSWEMPRAPIREQQSMSMALSKQRAVRGADFSVLNSWTWFWTQSSQLGREGYSEHPTPTLQPPLQCQRCPQAGTWTAQRPQDCSQSLLRRQWKSQTGRATSMLFRVSLSWNTAHVKKHH